ncbi:unnamed protein product [Cuscuta campestris]|uniref:Uncharacterized protein n=1 Tax=Cuscuta campestris TaxID=132261 RepID=A0A484NFQ5_9ASTE|nr:unnamed protein product [Cuscuta campestris]
MDSGPELINANDEGSNVVGKNKEFSLLEGFDKVADEDSCLKKVVASKDDEGSFIVQNRTKLHHKVDFWCLLLEMVLVPIVESNTCCPNW